MADTNNAAPISRRRGPEDEASINAPARPSRVLTDDSIEPRSITRRILEGSATHSFVSYDTHEAMQEMESKGEEEEVSMEGASHQGTQSVDSAIMRLNRDVVSVMQPNANVEVANSGNTATTEDAVDGDDGPVRGEMGTSPSRRRIGDNSGDSLSTRLKEEELYTDILQDEFDGISVASSMAEEMPAQEIETPRRCTIINDEKHPREPFGDEHVSPSSGSKVTFFSQGGNSRFSSSRYSAKSTLRVNTDVKDERKSASELAEDSHSPQPSSSSQDSARSASRPNVYKRHQILKERRQQDELTDTLSHEEVPVENVDRPSMRQDSELRHSTISITQPGAQSISGIHSPAHSRVSEPQPIPGETFSPGIINYSSAAPNTAVTTAMVVNPQEIEQRVQYQVQQEIHNMTTVAEVATEPPEARRDWRRILICYVIPASILLIIVAMATGFTVGSRLRKPLTLEPSTQPSTAPSTTTMPSLTPSLSVAPSITPTITIVPTTSPTSTNTPANTMFPAQTQAASSANTIIRSADVWTTIVILTSLTMMVMMTTV